MCGAFLIAIVHPSLGSCFVGFFFLFVQGAVLEIQQHKFLFSNILTDKIFSDSLSSNRGGDRRDKGEAKTLKSAFLPFPSGLPLELPLPDSFSSLRF